MFGNGGSRMKIERASALMGLLRKVCLCQGLAHPFRTPWMSTRPVSSRATKQKAPQPNDSTRPLLGGSSVLISRVISRVTILITHIRVLITHV